MSFRDFSQDSAVQQANRDARVRGVETNPLFTGGELVLDGVIVREIPEMGLPVTATDWIRDGQLRRRVQRCQGSQDGHGEQERQQRQTRQPRAPGPDVQHRAHVARRRGSSHRHSRSHRRLSTA